MYIGNHKIISEIIFYNYVLCMLTARTCHTLCYKICHKDIKMSLVTISFKTSFFSKLMQHYSWQCKNWLPKLNYVL